MVMRFIVITPRNLEDVASRELYRKNIKAGKEHYRKIIVDYDGEPSKLAELKAPDDVLIYLGEFRDTGHFTGNLIDLCKNLKKFDLKRAIEVCKKVREIPEKASFAITISTIGERNFTQEYLKKKVGETLSNNNLIFKEEGKPDLDFSLIIENEKVFFGLRLFKEPLHKRAFKKFTLPASLKSNLAFAMLDLADVSQEDVVLDPMCGIGTIPIEAAFIGAKAIGFDINEESIKLAKKNAKKAGKEINFEVKDATKTGLDKESIDKIVSNLPFGKQVSIDSNKELFRKFLKEIARILKKGGKAAFLTTHVKLIKALAKEANLKLIASREISLFGLEPVILIFRKV